MTIDEKRRLLGQFVRSHCERIAPDMPVRRRRTPGLRREELAARAGIGVTWCAWIEQGRDVSVSAATLARLALALALTPAERAYLFELAGRRDPDAPQSASISQAPEAITALVAALSYPAYGLDRRWDACCWNGAAERLFVGWLDEGSQKNLLRYMFTVSSVRDLLPDWEDRARRVLAEFRADYGRMLNDPDLGELVESQKGESDFFAKEWEVQSVLAREGGSRTFAHPLDGYLAFVQHTFSPAERPDYKLWCCRHGPMISYKENLLENTIPFPSPNRHPCHRHAGFDPASTVDMLHGSRITSRMTHNRKRPEPDIFYLVTLKGNWSRQS